MNAEANNELGNAALATSVLNLVRNIIGLPVTTSTGQPGLHTAIWNERRQGLAMENHRYFDVIRQSRAGTLFATKGWTVDKNELWPMPYKEILLSGGKLIQNPGYN